MANPTVVVGQLNDEELKKSIDNLVKNVDEGLKTIVSHTKTAVSEMQKELQKIGDIKVGSGGAADGGSSRRAKSQNAETKSIRESTAARKEYNATLDQTAQAMQKASGRSTVLETYDMQIALLIARLKDVRQDIDIFNAAIGSGKKTQIEFGQKGLEQANKEAELLMRQITALESKRGALANLIAPQGDSIKNFAKDLQVTTSVGNEGLRRLNDEFRHGNALLQQESTVLKQIGGDEHKISEERRRGIQAENAIVAATEKRAALEAELVRTQSTSARLQASNLVKAMSSGEAEMSVKNYEKLRDYLNQMNREYYNLMSTAEKQSPVGVALKKDIEIIETAIVALRRYMSASNSMESQKTNAESATLKSLKNELKALADQYDKLTASEINAGKDRGIVDKYQRISRAAQILQKNLSTPISFAAANNIQVRTLDDMAYKLKQLQAYKGGIDITKAGATEELKRADIAIKNLKADMDRLMGSTKQANTATLALTRSLNYMKNRLAFYFTVGATTSFVKQLIEIRGQYEMTERALGILVDSAQNGSRIFSELSNMSLISPYTLIELSNAARQLTAYGVAAKDVVDTTRRLADISAAVGAPIERISYALGHVQSFGYLTSLQARQFANAGIPLVKELADRFSELEGRVVSTEDVYARMKKHQVEFEDVMDVINAMTDEGGKFFNFQAKAADTLRVKLANLTLAWNNMLNDIGKSHQGIIEAPIKGLRALFESWKTISSILGDVIIAYGLVKGSQMLMSLSYGKSTLAIIKQTASMKGATAADYANIVSKNNLTKAQARLLISMNRGNDALRAAIVNEKILTTAQAQNAASANIFRIAWTRTWAGTGVLLNGVVNGIKAIGMALKTIPIFLIIGAIAELVTQVVNAGKETEELNKKITDNTKESIENIDKFFSDYKDSLDRLNGGYASRNEQEKMWSAIKEQIENSVAAAAIYIKRLEKIEDITERAKAGQDVLRNAQNIQGAVNAASRNLQIEVNTDALMWGLSKEGTNVNTKDLSKAIADLITKAAQQGVHMSELSDVYGELIAAALNHDVTDKAFDELLDSFKNGDDRILSAIKKIKNKERDLVSNVWSGWDSDANNLAKVFENYFPDDMERTQENVREFYAEISSAVKSQNAEIEKNSAYWDNMIDRLVVVDSGIGGNIQEHYTAYQKFFNMIRTVGGDSFETLADYITETGDYTIEEMENLWNRAVERFGQQDFVSFALINTKFSKESVKDLFDTFRTEAASSSKFMQNAFDEEFYGKIKKKLKESGMEYKNYFNDITDARRKYSRFRQKDDEDTIEYQKRLSEEYNKLKENVESLNKSLMSFGEKGKGSVVWEGIFGEKQEMESTMKIIEMIAALLHLSLDPKNKKAQKDVLGEALQKEVQLIGEIQKRYKEYRQMGVEAQTAIEKATDEYGKTLERTNKTLRGFGFATKSSAELADMSMRNVRDYYQSLLATANKLGNAKGIEAVEKAIASLNVEITKVDYKKITDGLNNELGKLKDEYELAIELDANPELGDIFANMFGIDKTSLPNDIYDYVNMMQNEADKAILAARENNPYDFIPFNLLTDDIKEWAEKTGNEVDGNLVKALTSAQNQAKSAMKKYTEDVFKQTKELEYKLADTNGKIAIEEEKLANLKILREKAVTEERKHLLDLQIQDQQNAIAKLNEEILQQLPTYERLFGNVAEHSGYMTRKLAMDYKKMLENAKDNNDGTYTVTDPISGERATITKKQRGTQIDRVNKELMKSQSTIKKIKEAFTKGEDGVIDYAKGIEYVGEEMQKLSDIVGTIGNISEALGANEQTTEDINDVAATIGGLGQAAQGYAKIQSGDILGGAADMLKGTWNAVSTWFDNSDKAISRQVKESEKTIKTLELTYIDLQHAISEAYGAGVVGAKRAMAAAKELELAELERQLRLEQSRKKKKQDEDKINDLKKQIKQLRYEIEDSITEITNDLLGSDVGGFAENLVSSMISAFKQGEDYMKTFEDSFDEMVDNMIMKSIVSRVVASHLDKLWDDMDARIKARSTKEADAYASAKARREEMESMSLDEMFSINSSGLSREQYEILKDMYDSRLAALRAAEEVAKKNLEAATEIGDEDISYLLGELAQIKPELGDRLKEILGQYYKFGQSSERELSALQQGIQGITEDTAGALEAITNGISQQSYLQSDLLTQIRDAVVGFDMDVQLGVFSQMLLQLQNNYIVIQSMQSMMENWTVPSGSGIRVELLS